MNSSFALLMPTFALYKLTKLFEWDDDKDRN